MNYIAAVGLTVLFLQPDTANWRQYLPTWWLFAALGVLLPTVFVVMGRAVDAAGIVKSDAAQRLSLFHPRFGLVPVVRRTAVARPPHRPRPRIYRAVLPAVET